MSRPRYTQAEDALILKLVKENPANLVTSFEVASEHLEGRSPKAISQRYYTVLKDLHNPIAVASNTGVVALCKNAKRTSVSPNNRSIVDAMLHTAFDSLTKEEAIKFLLKSTSFEDKKNMLKSIIRTYTR